MSLAQDIDEAFGGRWWRWVAAIVLPLIVAGIFRGCCVTFVDSYELGYRYDLRRGTTTALSRTGYFITPPIVVEIHTVDLRPMQVCITASGSTEANNGNGASNRVLNCKLVRFNPAGLMRFLELHGRNNYDHDKLAPLLRIYAYDSTGTQHPFITFISELSSQNQAAGSGVGMTSSAPGATQVR